MIVCDKIPYTSHKEAIDAAIAIAKKGKRPTGAYDCSICGMVHLHTKSKRKKIQKVKGPTTTNFEVKHSPVRAKPLRETMKRNRFQMPKFISKEMADHLKRLILGSNAMDKQK